MSVKNQIYSQFLNKNKIDKSQLNSMKSSKLHNSKTEKNLHGNHRSFMQAITGEINLENLKNISSLYNSREGISKYEMKSHPRIQQQ